MPNATYAEDFTGLAPSNLVTLEQHTITEMNSNTYRIIIPVFSPFFLDNLVVRHVDLLGIKTVLTEGIDYTLCLPYVGATRSIGKTVYGGISINNTVINGSIEIDYQTMGGSWAADANFVLAALAENVYNPRVTVWDSVTNVQVIFPPINHNQPLDNIYGMQALVDAINLIKDALLTAPPSANVTLLNHILDVTNPHNVTKELIGLPDVINMSVATTNEINLAQPVDKYITLAQAIQLINILRPTT